MRSVFNRLFPDGVPQLLSGDYAPSCAISKVSVYIIVDIHGAIETGFGQPAKHTEVLSYRLPELRPRKLKSYGETRVGSGTVLVGGGRNCVSAPGQVRLADTKHRISSHPCVLPALMACNPSHQKMTRWDQGWRGLEVHSM